MYRQNKLVGSENKFKKVGEGYYRDESENYKKSVKAVPLTEIKRGY